MATTSGTIQERGMKMANANWKTVGLPKCKPHDFSEEVLVTWIPRWNKSMRLVSTAVYVPHHWCTTEDLGWNSDDFSELEYCEEKDEWWAPCGWYETITNCIDDVGFRLRRFFFERGDFLPVKCDYSKVLRV